MTNIWLFLDAKLKEENTKNLHISARVKELAEEKNKLSQQLELSIADCAKLIDKVFFTVSKFVLMIW